MGRIPREVVVRIGLPRVGKEAVELLAASDLLILRGKNDGMELSAFHGIERAHGPFQRLLSLRVAVRAAVTGASPSKNQREGVREVSHE